MGTHSLKLHVYWFLDHPSSRQPDPACCRPRYSSKCSGTASGVATTQKRCAADFGVQHIQAVYYVRYRMGPPR